MEKIIYRLTLDTHKNGIQKTLQGFETADKIARRIAINLTSRGDAYKITDDVVAVMYVTTPNATEPSINECFIEDNTILYDVFPIVEEGITEMQMKLISVGVNGAESVLASPRFALEVTESGTSDCGTKQHITFTALENAIAKANAVYNKRLEKVDIDDHCVFRAYYGDGTVYENDELKNVVYDAIGKSEENAKTSEINAKASEDKAKASEDNAKTSETNAKASEDKANEYMEKAFYGTPDGYKTFIDNVKAECNRINSEIEVERSRINNLVTNNNDTEGNAELTDIRVGSDGTVYPSAGDAVRGQVGQLSSDIVECLKNNSKIEITTSNYQNFFNDLSSINVSSWYHIVGIKDIDESAPTEKTCLFIHFHTNNDYAWQIIIETGNEPNTYIRYKIGGNWGVWRDTNKTIEVPVPQPTEQTTFVVDRNGNGDFTSFVDCLTTIRENHIYNTEIYVKSGTYDIYEEMKAKYGSDYWENYNYLTSRYSNGLPFGYGMKIHGDNGVELVCHNDKETDARSYFSILNAMNDNGFEHLGATIEGIKFVASNIRYCVHFEFATYEVGGEYKVKDCSMYLDNSNNEQWHHSAGIGMGSGAFTTYIVENCDIHPTFSDHTEKKSAILWHNTAHENPKNKVIIKDNFCDSDSTVSIASSGNGTTKTPCIVTNNSVGIDLILINTDTDNVNVIEWNNTVRN